MQKLTSTDLYPLETYARERSAFRTRVIAHKQPRTVHLGAHLTLIFEDRLTIQYQIQEMLRIERIFEPAGIAEELEAYNPLIPDGRNLKATLLIEYADAAERAQRLVELNGIEREIEFRIDGQPALRPFADEDLDRATADKTSAVHFLRFEFSPKHIAALRGGAAAALAVAHAAYSAETSLDAATRDALCADFD